MYACNAKESMCGGRNMGGVLVLVRKSIASSIKRINDTFEFGVLLTIDKSLLDLDRDCVYCSVYIPPENSPFYRNIKGSVFERIEASLFSDDLLGKT